MICNYNFGAQNFREQACGIDRNSSLKAKVLKCRTSEQLVFKPKARKTSETKYITTLEYEENVIQNKSKVKRQPRRKKGPSTLQAMAAIESNVLFHVPCNF